MDELAALVTSGEYELVDISHMVEPGENPDRPFAIQKGRLADDSYRYDVETHSHVGTHVEGGAHFYGRPEDDLDVATITGEEDNRAIDDYPLDQFYGAGVLFPVTEAEVTPDVCEDRIGNRLETGDVVVVRNDTDASLAKADAYDGQAQTPSLTVETGEWLAERGVRALVFDDVQLGRDTEESNHFHDVMLSEGCVFVEFVENLDAITRDRFVVFALPYSVDRLGSSFCRAVVFQRT